MHLLIGACLVVVRPGCFAGGHLPRAQAVGGALLLVGFAVVHGVGLDGISVVVLVVDLARRAVLLAIDLLALLSGQRAAIGGTVVVHLLVDIALALVGAGRFAGGHLAGAQTVGDTLVLVPLAPVDRRPRGKLRIVGMCSEGGIGRSRTHHGGAVVHVEALSWRAQRDLLMLHLIRSGLEVLLLREACFFRRGPRPDAPLSTVVGHGGVVVHDHGAVVHIGDIHHVDVRDRAIVEEGATAPLAAAEAYAAIPKAVVDAAVEADVRSPVACVEAIEATFPAPVGGGPEHAHCRRLHPHSGHPEVAVHVVIGPIAGRPEIAGAGAKGLRVDRQNRRGDANLDDHGGMGLLDRQGSEGANQGGYGKKPANRAKGG